MCGICGWVNWNGNLTNETETLQQMNQRLTPRGPDQAGIWTSTYVGLAHRRLAVLDLELGIQPMRRIVSGNEYVIVYNGEIYNFKSIRSTLEREGVSFIGTGDTEVLLQSYIMWGANCLDYLNGIFAFAIWDVSKQELFVARDRLGVKPLFFAQTEEQFIFASEIKSLLAHPNIRPVIDSIGVMELFMLGPARTPGKTPFPAIKELLPGTFGIYKRNAWNVQPYWQLQPQHLPDSADALSEILLELLDEVVDEQQISDVPLGFFLSGGLDSSALTALAAQKRQGIHTFSIDFLEQKQLFQANSWSPEQDEWAARAMSSALGTKHRTIELHPELLYDALFQALEARDLPGMSDIDASLLLFCREVKKEVTVAISGEGADELFGGYPWFLNVSKMAPLDQHAWPLDRFPWLNEEKRRASFIQKYILKGLQPLDYAKTRLMDALRDAPHHPEQNPLEKRMRDLTYLNIAHFMPVLLDRKDRMSMASGLEVRVPFCDHRLVEFAWNLPWKYKRFGGREKGLLRHAMRETLPNEIVNRLKSPFPRVQHPQFHQFVLDATKQMIASKDEPIFDIVDPIYLSTFVQNQNPNDESRWFGQLFGNIQWCGYLLQMNQWLKKEKIQFYR